MHNKIKMNSVLGKRILSLIRKGDYVHPGEEDAIDLVFRNIPKDQNRLLLDVGCALGGTVKYLEDNGYGRVTGLDLNAAGIEYAKFIDKIKTTKEAIISMSDEQTYQDVRDAYLDIYNAYNNKILKAVLIYAKAV